MTDAAVQPPAVQPPAVEEAAVETPLGDVWLRVEHGALREMIFIDEHRRKQPPDLNGAAKLRAKATIKGGNGSTSAASRERPVQDVDAGSPALAKIAGAVERYFAGDVDALDDIPIEADGTDFQRAVWDAIREIPAGRTASYQEIARSVGRPAAVRAVGTATGRNPVSIVVPCHRVIRSDGSLGGYGGGLHRKEWFLDHERRHSATKEDAA